MVKLAKNPINQFGATPLTLLLPVLAILSFILIASSFEFKDRLFSFLFPKPSSYAISGGYPVKLAAIYRSPQNPSGIKLTSTEINQKFKGIIATPDSSSWSGFNNGPFLYYALFDQTEGPPGLDTQTAQTKTCAALGKDNYISLQENSVTTYFHGEFCQIHDSIVNKTSFDHDLNSSTPNISATEDWFLHDVNGNRLTFLQGSVVFYGVNPANLAWREYFIARLFRDLSFNVGDKIQERGWLSYIQANGIFLDNVGLSWNSIKNHSVTKSYPKEFISSSVFADSVYSFVQQIYVRLHDSTKGYNYPLWANIIAGYDTGSDWNRLEPYLNGGMKEDFVLNWNQGPYSASTILNQLNQAEYWIAKGKSYVAIGQARYDSQTNIDSDTKFSLAAYLLITDGNLGYYKLRSSSYSIFHEYPEYYYQLGQPKGVKFQKSSSPLIYRRDFECGFVELNLTNPAGVVSYTSGCTPGSSPTPVATPSTAPAITPTPSPLSDTIAPSVSIISPANGSVLDKNSSVLISASASDNVGVTKVEFYINNSLKSTDTSSPYTYSWKVSGKAGTSYNIQAKAYDSSGKSTLSERVNVTSK